MEAGKRAAGANGHHAAAAGVCKPPLCLGFLVRQVGDGQSPEPMLLYHPARFRRPLYASDSLMRAYPDSQPLSTRIDAIAADFVRNHQLKPLTPDR
jgi:hypothetical protein